MMEMRWLEYQELAANVPSNSDTQYGKTFERAMVTKQKLQYRQKVDATIRAGMWDNEGLVRTANYQWTEWQDVPVQKQ